MKQELASLQDDECATEDEEEVVEAAVTINTALVDTFCGRFNEAVKRLHELAAPALSTAPESPKGGPAAGVPPGSMLAAEVLRQNSESKRTGRLPALLTMQLLAANTFIVLHQYVTGSERCTIPNSVASFEGLLRRYPVEASRMLPTVMNLRRIYEWHTTSGQHQRRSMLEAVVDACTVERVALPKWALATDLVALREAIRRTSAPAISRSISAPRSRQATVLRECRRRRFVLQIEPLST